MRRAFHPFSWGSLTSFALGKEPSNFLGLSSGFFDEETSEDIGRKLVDLWFLI